MKNIFDFSILFESRQQRDWHNGGVSCVPFELENDVGGFRGSNPFKNFHVGRLVGRSIGWSVGWATDQLKMKKSSRSIYSKNR